MTESPTCAEKFFVRVSRCPSIFGHDDLSLRALDEVDELVVNQNDLRTTVLENIRDLWLGQACVDRADDCPRGKDTLVCICMLRESRFSSGAFKTMCTSYEGPIHGCVSGP